MATVAVASRSFSRHPILRDELIAHYPAAKFNENGRSLSGAELIEFLGECDKAIVALEVINEEILRALPGLTVISKYGVGLDTLDLDAMQRRGVRLGWTPGVNARSVAELAVAFAIALRHEVPAGLDIVAEGGWRQVQGRQLSGATIGLIGCGHVGKEVVRMLSPFRCRVLAHDIRHFPEFYAEHDVTAVSLETLLRESDIVSLHVPLDSSTRGLLGSQRLSLLKPTAVVVNTARGSLVDEQTIAQMINSGRLAGAAFDVFADEPPFESELIRNPKILCTPHIGGSTAEAVLAMGRAAIAGLNAARLPSEYDDLMIRRD